MKLSPRNLLMASIFVTLAWAGGCKKKSFTDNSNTSSLEGQIIETTYYPFNGEQNMGPGHFSCAQYNSVTQWYVAPSDTFGDPNLWSGPPCPAAQGYADCGSVQQTCGKKLKLTCRDKCRQNAPAIVVMITDYCPKNHPANIQNGSCQGGPHFDIGKPVWDQMQGSNDNISISYEMVSDSTPLGPVSGDAVQQTSTATGTSNVQGGNVVPSSGSTWQAGSGNYPSCPGNKYCKNGWGWWNPGESGCAASSPGWKGYGCSCTCPAAGTATTTSSTGTATTSTSTSQAPATTTTSSQTSAPTTSTPQTATSTTSSSSIGSDVYPSCPGNQYCNKGWGWLSPGEGGCSAGGAGWKGNGCSCTCSSTSENGD